MITPQQLGSFIHAARTERKMSQNDLATTARLPQSQISRIERGDVAEPSFMAILAICKALGVTLEDAAQESAQIQVSARVKQLFPWQPQMSDDPAADKLVGIGQVFGVAGSGTVSLTNDNFTGHMLITGVTGCGKSVLLQSVAVDLARAASSVIFVDPHGASADDVAALALLTLPDRIDDIIVVDLPNAKFNPLAVSEGAYLGERQEAVRRTVALLCDEVELFISAGTAPRLINYIHSACTALVDWNAATQEHRRAVLGDAANLLTRKMTLADVPRLFTDDVMRRLVVSMCDNEVVKEGIGAGSRWEQMSARNQLAHVKPLIEGFEKIVDVDGESYLIHESDDLPIEQWMTAGNIVIIKSGRFDTRSRQWLTAVTRSLIDRAVARQERAGPAHSLRIVIDEAHSIMTPEMGAVNALSRADDINYGLVLSTQFIEQFDPQLVAILRRKVRNIISFASATTLAGETVQMLDQGQSVLEAIDLMRLPMYVAYANLDSGEAMSRSRGTGPFTLRPAPPVEIDRAGSAWKLLGRALDERTVGRAAS
jgi:transcriptional regulator with XRE-family HTH domain